MIWGVSLTPVCISLPTFISTPCSWLWYIPNHRLRIEIFSLFGKQAWQYSSSASLSLMHRFHFPSRITFKHSQHNPSNLYLGTSLNKAPQKLETESESEREMAMLALRRCRRRPPVLMSVWAFFDSCSGLPTFHVWFLTTIRIETINSVRMMHIIHTILVYSFGRWKEKNGIEIMDLI